MKSRRQPSSACWYPKPAGRMASSTNCLSRSPLKMTSCTRGWEYSPRPFARSRKSTCSRQVVSRSTGQFQALPRSAGLVGAQEQVVGAHRATFQGAVDKLGGAEGDDGVEAAAASDKRALDKGIPPQPAGQVGKIRA